MNDDDFLRAIKAAASARRAHRNRIKNETRMKRDQEFLEEYLRNQELSKEIKESAAFRLA